MTCYEKSIKIYDDNIGSVEYVSHMGSDLTVVNSARVSFGKQKNKMDEKDEKLIRYLIRHKHTSTLEHNVITFRFCVPLLCVASIIDIELGLIMKSLEGIQR